MCLKELANTPSANRLGSSSPNRTGIAPSEPEFMPTIAPSTPSLLSGSVDAQASMLRIAREDIIFFNRSRDLVQLEVTVHNRGEVVSRPTWMRVNAAPLGAFVDSQQVARLRVPRISPGGSTQVSTTLSTSARSPRMRDAQLPADSLRQFDSRRANWAGNFDVHIGEESAERHCAAAIRLQPGVENFALFFVGQGLDSFRFNFLGDGESWSPTLELGSASARRALLGHRTTPGSLIQPGRWWKWRMTHDVTLIVRPPAGVSKGLLAVEIEKRSSGKKAFVEFGFGVDTIPPRCFRS